MKKLVLFILLIGLAACRQPEIIYADFTDFHPTKVTESSLVMEDGSLNPELQQMANPALTDPQTDNSALGDTLAENPSVRRIASVSYADFAREFLGRYYANSVVQIAGTYTGHDIDGSPLTLSGKIIVPRKGSIRQIIVVSHYTIGAYYEAPSETFPIEALYAGMGYAVVAPDYLGFGVTRHRIHPYMHAELTASSVVDLLLAAQGYLDFIGRAPEDEQVILMGYSQGGSATLAALRMLERDYADRVKIKQVYCGAGPYELCALYDYALEKKVIPIPYAIPMIIQGLNEGERLGLQMQDFLQPRILEGFDKWVNSKEYNLGEINRMMGTRSIEDILLPEARDRSVPETAKLYESLHRNSLLDFTPRAPLFLFHSTTDATIPYDISLLAVKAFRGKSNLRTHFDDYGAHQSGFLKFVSVVGDEL